MAKGILKQPTNLSYQFDEMPPPLPNSLPPLESANERLDRLLHPNASRPKDGEPGAAAAPPPIRGGVLKNSSNLSNGDGSGADRTVKKVSWNDNPSTAVLADSEPSEDAEEEEEEEPQDPDRFSLQDIDDVLGQQASTGTDWLNNYVSGSTPGVIGAQEVYNDPRQRIEAERLKSNQSQTSSDSVPEKLSFKEKMKMFAQTTAAQEDQVGRSKIKTSRAQREIEGVNGGGGGGSDPTLN